MISFGNLIHPTLRISINRALIIAFERLFYRPIFAIGHHYHFYYMYMSLLHVPLSSARVYDKNVIFYRFYRCRMHFQRSGCISVILCSSALPVTRNTQRSLTHSEGWRKCVRMRTALQHGRHTVMYIHNRAV